MTRFAGKDSDVITKAAKIIAGASRAVAFCGAGISAESGIATFRDPGGLWDRLDPVKTGSTRGLIDTLARTPEKVVPVFVDLLDALGAAQPNPGHKALAELERMGILASVITQNIDNLHQEAGNTRVIEVHGNGFRLRCLSCGNIETRDRRELIRETKEKLTSVSGYDLDTLFSLMPVCTECGSVMRPDVVMFGEPVMHMTQAFAEARACDVMLALGTSGAVQPAAWIPVEAKQAGARVIVINPNEDSFSAVSDIYVPMKTGEALPMIVELVKKELKR
ncbi:MAG: hypothetical protein B5M56_09860 [Desulfococcus sp. 4484_241]|nr:MAG: hypothetical protein B5M56_09860 [Desulfococcus sp. 4484_241]